MQVDAQGQSDPAQIPCPVGFFPDMLTGMHTHITPLHRSTDPHE